MSDKKLKYTILFRAAESDDSYEHKTDKIVSSDGWVIYESFGQIYRVPRNNIIMITEEKQ